MKRRWLTPVLALAAVVGSLAGSAREAKAQEIQLTGPLAGAPAVRKLRLYREGRFEFAPSYSFSLLDEYRRTHLVGARLQYNVFDWLGVGAWGGYGLVSIPTSLTDEIDARAVRNSRTAPNVGPRGAFTDQTAKTQWIANPQVTVSPFRGKLAMFNSIFVDTDLYVHAGVAFVGLQERGDCGVAGAPLCSQPQSFALQSRMAVAPSFGLGLNLYASSLVSVGLEYRALPYSWNRAGFDTRGGGADGKSPNFVNGPAVVDSEDRTFAFNQFFTLAIGFSFPKPEVSE